MKARLKAVSSLAAACCAIAAICFQCSTTDNVAGNGSGTGTGNPQVECLVRYASGEPASGIAVRLRPDTYSADKHDSLFATGAIQNVSTDTNGFAHFNGIPQGEYVIEFVDSVSPDSILSAVRTFSIQSSTDADSIPNVTLNPAGAVSGSIDMQAVDAQSVVQVLAMGLDYAVEADNSGRFTFAALPPSDTLSLVVVSKAGNREFVDKIGVAAPSNDSINIGTIGLSSNRYHDSLIVRSLLDSNMLQSIAVESVVVFSGNRIISINIENAALAVLPSEIARLSALESLSLSANQLKVIPLSVYACITLKVFSIYHNQLEAIPSDIRRLQKLERVSFGFNNIISVSVELFLLPNLWSLDLGANAIDTLEGDTAFSTTIRNLNLSNNKLRVLPDNLCTAQGLHEIHAQHNQLVSIPACIDSLKNLVTLELNDNLLAQLPSSMANMNALRGGFVSVKNNRLCTVAGPLRTWLDTAEPGWDTTQTCP